MTRVKLRSNDASMYRVRVLLCIWGDVNACSGASKACSHGILPQAWLVELPTAALPVTDNVTGTVGFII